jgi:hypothetical protein
MNKRTLKHIGHTGAAIAVGGSAVHAYEKHQQRKKYEGKMNKVAELAFNDEIEKIAISWGKVNNAIADRIAKASNNSYSLTEWDHFANDFLLKNKKQLYNTPVSKEHAKRVSSNIGNVQAFFPKNTPMSPRLQFAMAKKYFSGVPGGEKTMGHAVNSGYFNHAINDFKNIK